MKALVYHGPGQRAWESVPDPKLQDPTDVIVRIDTSTICGTDLHILKGDVPTVEPGRILGHEAVGTVVETGDAVTTLEPGDRVLVSCITSCGRCRGPCRRRRRPRTSRDASPRATVDPGRHDHYRPRRHVHDAEAPAARRRR
jgi:threonine dehydrogenase-like Zn-dependent dehydrogenase